MLLKSERLRDFPRAKRLDEIKRAGIKGLGHKNRMSGLLQQCRSNFGYLPRPAMVQGSQEGRSAENKGFYSGVNQIKLYKYSIFSIFIRACSSAWLERCSDTPLIGSNRQRSPVRNWIKPSENLVRPIFAHSKFSFTTTKFKYRLLFYNGNMSKTTSYKLVGIACRRQ